MNLDLDNTVIDWVDNLDTVRYTQMALNDCAYCNGTGGRQNVDWLPYGATNVPKVSFEMCDCVYDGAKPYFVAMLYGQLSKVERIKCGELMKEH